MTLNDISFCKTFDLDEEYSFEGHTHNSCETNIILDGNMEVSVEGAVIKLSKGDMLVWSPNMFHFNYIAAGEQAKLLSIHFSMDNSPFDKSNLFFYHLSLEESAIAEVFINEVNNNGFHTKSAAYPLLEALVYMCVSNSDLPEFSNDSSASIYSKAMEMMTKNQNRILTIPEMAHNCGVCATTLKSSFKRHSGKTIKKYYSELKLETAKKMLIEGETSEEITYKLGFSSASYFSQFFKNNSGMNVREFVKSIR